MLSTRLWFILWPEPWPTEPWPPAELLCLRPEIFRDNNDDARGPCALGKESCPSKTLRNEG